MNDRYASYRLPVGRQSDRVTDERLDVLYVDSDASVREATRRAIGDYRDSIAIASVAGVDSALELSTEQIDCLVVDPTGLEDAIDQLFAALDCPVVYYTAQDPSELDDALLAAGETVVEKDAESIRGTFLAEKIVSVSSQQVDKRAYALTEALGDIERRATHDETAVLADEGGELVWTSAPLDEQIRGVPSDTETVTGLIEALVPDTPTGRKTRERLEASPAEPVTLRGAKGAQYVLWTESRLPEAAGSLRLIRLRDVTDTARHQARERLLDLLVEFAQDGLYTLDADGTVDFCNEAFAAMLGYEPTELLGRHASTLLAPDELSKGQGTIQQLIEDPEQEETTIELTFIHRNGTERELSIHYSLLEGHEGRYRGLIGVARDVTDQLARRRELTRYKNLFESLVAHFPNGGVSLFDEDLRYIEAGGQDLEDLGLSREDFVGKTPSDVFPPESAAVTEDAYRAALDGEHRSFEDRFGGSVYAVQALPIHSESGEISAGLAVAQNVTDRVERERELEQTTERLELALEGADLGVWDWNVETGDVTFDERWASMLGFDLAEIDQRLETWEELVHPDDLEETWDAIQRHFEGETELYQCDHRLATKSGEYRWIRDLGRVFERDEDGNPQRMVGIHQDITDRKERQQEIETQRDELETLTQIHVLIQDVIRALGSAVTSAEIEEMVCQRLVESEFYELAWIGERSIGKSHLTWKTGAGDDGHYDVVAERAKEIDREDDPGVTALETGEIQVIHDVADDERMAHWREAALDHDLRSAAVVPLVHEDVVHSALLVYANQPEAFSDRAIEAFTVLGEMVGFAFTSVQNRHLLLRDRMVELEFQSNDDRVWPVAVATRHDCRLEFAGCVSAGERYLDYVGVSGAAPDDVLESCLELGPVTDGRVVSRTDDETGGRLELTVTEAYQPTMLDVGAQPTEIVADPEGITIRAETPLDADPRTVHQTLSASIDGIRLTSKRQWTRDDKATPSREQLLDQLTTRQVEVLEAAYLAGYFAWPRDTTAEELADSLDISSPTLHQHLRRASLNLLEAILDS